MNLREDVVDHAKLAGLLVQVELVDVLHERDLFSIRGTDTRGQRTRPSGRGGDALLLTQFVRFLVVPRDMLVRMTEPSAEQDARDEWKSEQESP